MFFQCVEALFDPVNNIKRSVKWALATHTTALFFLLTVSMAIDRCMIALAYIDNRSFPGTEIAYPGPLGYFNTGSEAMILIGIGVVPLNQWLADGLLVGSAPN